MSVRYYQLGGYRGQITSPRSLYDDKDLANTIAGPSSPLRSKEDPGVPIELVLGIKRHGSSHLLLTTGQLEEFTRSRGPYLVNSRGNPFFARDFEALSPIFFYSVEELTKKLSTLKPKATKSAKDQQRDTSQANRIYDSDNVDIYRGAFEHGRVIYRILNNLVDAPKYSVNDLSWTRNLRISSFVFNVKGIDDRKRDEKLRNPIVLDVGFCDVSLPSVEADLSTSRHIINQGNLMMGGNRKAFKHGKSETIHNTSMAERIREIFKDYEHRASKTMVLLVYNQELTLNYLHKMNIDTSTWSYDLKELLYSDSSTARNSYSDRRYSESHQRSGYDRSRSRSPSRRPDPRAPYRPSPPPFQSNRGSRYPESCLSSLSASQYPPNAGTRLYPPVCMLDVEKLYTKLMSTSQAKGITDIARHLGMTGVDGMCAGNEAVLMINIWREMVSGPSIDEQRELRSKGSEQMPAASSAGPSKAPQSPVGSDDEQDPNDVVAPQASSKLERKTFDDSDYGDDDDSASDSD